MVRKSLKQRVCAGDVVSGAMVFEFFSPGMARIAEVAGCEFLIYDMEHSGLSIETLKQLHASARGLSIAPIARVPRGEYHFLARALDVGMHGVMIPMVESASQAKAIAEATHYPPRGRRGAGFGFAHDDYVAGSVEQKIKRLDARNLVIAQIETERGLAAVEEIAAVDGIDVLWLGHFDLTNFLGIPGQFDNKLYIDAIKRIVAAGRKRRKGLGFMTVDPATTRRYREYGFNMLASGTDPAIMVNGIRTILAPLGDEK
ncbi:MAG: hypothetical protein FJX46_07000 [Alphaproteobacteria bacterium]|nr:hypothetical protein [Alphaproteobacteria bacterium]